MERVVAMEHTRLGLVEDSDADSALLARMFAEQGPISRWPTAEAAIAAFERGEVDLAALPVIVVDLHLPGIDGVQLISRVRRMPGGERPVICVLSSSDAAADHDRADRAGADGYLVKPEDLAGLRELPRRLAEVVAAR